MIPQTSIMHSLEVYKYFTNHVSDQVRTEVQDLFPITNLAHTEYGVNYE